MPERGAWLIDSVAVRSERMFLWNALNTASERRPHSGVAGWLDCARLWRHSTLTWPPSLCCRLAAEGGLQFCCPHPAPLLNISGYEVCSLVAELPKRLGVFLRLAYVTIICSFEHAFVAIVSNVASPHHTTSKPCRPTTDTSTVR